MREIKFRAWDKIEEKMWNPAIYNGVPYAYNGLGGFVRMDGELLDPVMQYTGLKDKNGTEIFESDKLIDENNGELWIVKFDDRGCFVAVNPVDELDSLLLDDLDFAVIGNIYED